MLRLQERKNIGKVILDINLQPKVKPVEEEQPVKKSRFSTKLLRRSDKNKDEKKDGDKLEDNKTDENNKSEENNKTEIKDEVTNGEKVEATA